MLEQNVVTVKSGSTWHKICPFPVGYIYLSYTNSSPASTFGGTWTAINNGGLLRAAAAANTGGSKTIGVTQIPSHSHRISLKGNGSAVSGGAEWAYAVNNSGYAGSSTGSGYIETTGGQGVLALLSELLCLVSKVLINASLVEVNK